MNEQTSKRMKEMVSAVRSRAQRAEREFDRAADEIQWLASRSIDLFGGTATSQVADIAVKSKMACDRLYSAYQSLIAMLDDECRPLLSQDPSLEAVKEVRDMIVWLNNESKIENNFTASLNSYSLGNVASGRYMPAMHALTIQSFWETKYDMFPGRQEEEARLRAQQALLREQANARAAEQAAQAQARYEAEMAVWNAEAERINARRSELLQQQFGPAREALIQSIRDRYVEAMTDAKERHQILTYEKDAAQRKLSRLGVFDFGEKKQCKSTIEACSQKLQALSLEVQTIKENFEKEKQAFPEELSKCKEALEKKINEENPLPPKPKRGFVSSGAKTAQQIANESIKRAMYEFLERHGKSTVSDIAENCSACYGLANMKISALLSQMVKEGTAERTEDKRKAYFNAV